MAKTPECPFYKKPCIGHDCSLFVHVTGHHPQTGAHVDQWDCSFRWLPLLMIENSLQQRHTAGEISAFRSEMRQDNVSLAKMFLANQAQAEADADGQQELLLVSVDRDKPRG